MKPYRLDQLKCVVSSHFDARSVQAVMGWFKANEGRRPVVVVGAGYTRNAKLRTTGARANAPLWATLSRELASDLNNDTSFSPAAYDALTLAELYEEEFGPNALHNRLLSLLDDGQYEPDIAHQALLAYESEAIVTTNFLDTVLERCATSCFPVVLDSDLTIYDRQAEKRQLIYFHGHRSNRDSWVFTRSQFEDVFKSRPIITTRVRQLLSQYPVLAVGYSLADPDFHQIYRQVSLDMARRHPLGLAILVREPAGAERRHWERIGLRIAVLKQGADPHDAFAAFFGLDPNGPLPPPGTDKGSNCATSRKDSTAQSDYGGLREALDQIAHFGERQQYLLDVWDEDDARQARDANYRSPYYDRDRYALWLACIEKEIPSQELDKVNSEPPISSEQTRTGTPEQSSTAPSVRAFSRLPSSRFRYDWRFARLVDVLLTCRAELGDALARWIAVGVERDVLEGSDRVGNYVDLLAWLCKWLVDNAQDPDGARRTARPMFAMCVEVAAKYYPDRVLRQVLEDARALEDSPGIKTGIEDSQDSIRGQQSPVVQALRDGFTAGVNGEWEKAWGAYEKAAEIAKKGADGFLYWVALRGQSAYSSWDWTALDFGALQSRARRLDRLITQAERSPQVRRWTERKDQRLRELEKSTIEALKKRERQRVFPSRGWSFNNYAHNLWRHCRDLDAAYAAPREQIEILLPLLDNDAYGSDRAGELELRLKFNIDRTVEWLELLQNECLSNIAEQTERDAKMMAVFTRESASATEDVARLEALPAIVRCSRYTDLPWMAEFLNTCKRKHGAKARTHNCDCALFHRYPKAWQAYASQAIDSVAFAKVREYSKGIDSVAEREEFLEHLQELPWEEWLACDTVQPDDLVKLVFDSRETCPTEEAISAADAGVGWSLFEITKFGREFGRPPLGEGLARRIAEWNTQVLLCTTAQVHLFYAHRAPVHLGWVLTEEDADARVRHVDSVLALVARLRQQEGDEERAGIRTAAAVIGDLLDLGVPLDKLRPELEPVLHVIDVHWDQTMASLKRNPHMISPYDYLFAQCIARQAVPDLECARARLLELVKLSPDVLPRLADALDPAHWGDHWGELVEQIQLTMGGARGGEESTTRLLRALDLWLAWLEAGAEPRDLPVEIGVLTDLGILAVSNENHLIANRAAYGVIRYAGCDSLGVRLGPIVAALKNMAQDTRVAVRHGAAFGAAWLGHMAAENSIRELAAEIGTQLKSDPSAWVQRQLRFGDAKGRLSAERRATSR